VEVHELIRAAKLRPGMSYATSGAGTQQHFAGEWFAHIAGIKLDHVPYRGAGQAINDLQAIVDYISNLSDATGARPNYYAASSVPPSSPPPGLGPRSGLFASAASISLTASVSVLLCTAAISHDNRLSAAL
jgi:hypothetical protein